MNVYIRSIKWWYEKYKYIFIDKDEKILLGICYNKIK